MLRPLNTQVLIRPDDAPVMTGSGLHIPANVAAVVLQQQQKGSATGTVVDVGPDVRLITATQRVVFGQYAGDKFTIDRVPYVIMPSSEIDGILED